MKKCNSKVYAKSVKALRLGNRVFNVEPPISLTLGTFKLNAEKVLLTELPKKLFPLYSKDLSTRDIKDIFEDIHGTQLSKSTVLRFTNRMISKINNGLPRHLSEK